MLNYMKHLKLPLLGLFILSDLLILYTIFYNTEWLRIGPKLQKTFSRQHINNVEETVTYDDVEYNFSYILDKDNKQDIPRIIPNSIAIGVALISKKANWDNVDKIKETFPFFRHFLPSFCPTVSNGFKYNFFFSYDYNDVFYKEGVNRKTFSVLFSSYISQYCTNQSTYSLKFVKCLHSGKLAWAQNDAMMTAYMANMEYYYRVNDDTIFDTKGWTEIFIKTLQTFDPPNIGVVGPKHSGGNLNILTYDFVHYTHVQIHGCYYPRTFKNWFGDDWITGVYKPNRSVKVPGIHIKHTLESGRYQVVMINSTVMNKLITLGKENIKRYTDMIKSQVKNVGDKVIVWSLKGDQPQQMFGAIRNAQLMPIYFPGWTLRLYIPYPTSYNQKYYIPLPHAVVNKLKLLKVHLVLVNPDVIKTEYILWKYLVIDDLQVKKFIIKNMTHRINENDKQLADESMKKNLPLCLSGFRDKKNPYITEGLIAGQNEQVRKHIGFNINGLLSSKKIEANLSDVSFLKTYILPKIQKSCILNKEKNVKK